MFQIKNTLITSIKNIKNHKDIFIKENIFFCIQNKSVHIAFYSTLQKPLVIIFL